MSGQSSDGHRPAGGGPSLAGTPREIEQRVTRWLVDGPAEALVVRTSGSSGAPKDVALSGSALRWSAAATLARLGGPGGWVLALPAHYVAGLQVIVRSFLAGESPVVLSEHPDLATATAAVTADRRYLSAVPTQLYRWLSRPDDRAALRRYDAVLVGGAAADPVLVGDARARGVAIVTTYGMSETCGGCVYDGEALDGVAVAIGVDGAIRLTGPVLFDGYVGDPGLTDEVLRDGWLHTPDLGRFDADGRLDVIGRADDVVQSGGVSIAVPAVERRISGMPNVSECAVVAVPDAEWGCRLIAYVATDAGRPAPSLAQVRDFVSAAHPRSWAPRDVVVTTRLPYLESGKIDRRALRIRSGAAPSP